MNRSTTSEQVNLNKVTADHSNVIEKYNLNKYQRTLKSMRQTIFGKNKHLSSAKETEAKHFVDSDFWSTKRNNNLLSFLRIVAVLIIFLGSSTNVFSQSATINEFSRDVPIYAGLTEELVTVELTNPGIDFTVATIVFDLDTGIALVPGSVTNISGPTVIYTGTDLNNPVFSLTSFDSGETVRFSFRRNSNCDGRDFQYGGGTFSLSFEVFDNGVVVPIIGPISNTTTDQVIYATDQDVIASNSGPVCEGEELRLYADPSIQGATYFWTGPNGFSSTEEDPEIDGDSITLADAGEYRVVLSKDGCASIDTGVTTVVVNPAPTDPTPSSVPVCEGTDVQILAGAVGTPDSVIWDGPLNYSSTDLNPVLTNPTAARSGEYCLIAYYDGCPTNEVCALVTVISPDAPPIPTNSGPVCNGDSVQLFANALADTFIWNGPGGFSSDLQNPWVSPAIAGEYTLVLKTCWLRVRYR